MKKLIFILCFLTSLTFLNAQEWETVKLNDKMQISFPYPPEVDDFEFMKVFQMLGDEYLINVGLTNLNINPNFNANDIDQEKFYDQFLKGGMDGAEDSNLLQQKNIKVNSYLGREAIYTKDFMGIDDIKVIKRLILVDGIMVTYEIWELAPKDNTVLIETFFKSFKIL